MSDEPTPLHGHLAPPEGGPSPAGHELTRLVEIMRVLRSPVGCPWDREQTLASLAPYVLEEAHEVVDAIERGALDDLCGEIGDLVFEGVFLAQLTSEAGTFTIADALRSVADKLVRRHPHVFVQPAPAGAGPAMDTSAPPAPPGPTFDTPAARPPAGRTIDTPAAVKVQWDEIKAQERAGAGKSQPGPMDGIPPSLPALMAAHEIGKRAARVRFDWPDVEGVVAKVEEELHELRAEISAGDTSKAREELGDLLFSIANLARRLDVDPEAALRAANRKFLARFRVLSARLDADGLAWDSVSLDEMEARWQAVKASEA